MKIVYCIVGTFRSGGMERVLANKANYLAAHGHEVIITTTDQADRPPFFKLDKRIRCINLDINYEENNGHSLYDKLIHYPGKQRRHKVRLQKLLLHERPDITVSMFCNEISFLPMIHDGSAKVLEVHFSKFKRVQYGRKGLWAWVDKLRSRMDEHWVRRYDKFVVLTHEDARLWGTLPNLEVIYNASSFAQVLPSPLTQKRVLAVGRFTPQKGFDLMVDAWSEVAKSCPDWQLCIVGDGSPSERKALQDAIDKRQLNTYIQLCPPTPNIEKLYAESSLVVMTSRYEGLPMILIEAQTFGLPIVSYDCQCGPCDIITDGYDGYLVAMGDAGTWAQRCITLMHNDALRQRMGQNATESSKRFNEQVIMQQWERLFMDVTSRKR